jgi:hypothetical protein
MTVQLDKVGRDPMFRMTITAVAAVLVLLGVFISFVPEADAVVCARGVYRAGCAGPNGAVVAHRPAAAGCAWVNGRRICR